jgi:hypothetical protein
LESLRYPPTHRYYGLQRIAPRQWTARPSARSRT